jgi:hypothetical protein
MTALAGSMKTYAPSPVWSESRTTPVKFQGLPKKKAVKLWHRARDFERKTLRIPTQAAHLFRSEAAHGSDVMAPSVLISSRPPF